MRVLTAITLIYANGARITMAAGTILALQYTCPRKKYLAVVIHQIDGGRI